ncbi:hypothetical protein EI42_01467 [Thermosporothrix hazakensis]|jgi:hypothetical protein|uniref:DUF885 domain-containing protein n=2 Tax=Thermosporothrix TaxID=768650 RepID=A0A326UAR2_THEHA|nr:hypothetical protein [Thermosporothrix hazakensis]PZW32922.1 hypothetical protein EI42_01467 [Thermosporothrix hazakensis]BBH90903.1 hypothetical protein KTC_56540 [Thermosporothrix sp. COM3]GCE48954.1 hypothetical protein KTH_38230 [Thermosporothrix hazakensis]
MSEQWFKNYVTLAFQLDAAIHKVTETSYVDSYYGPPEWKEEALTKCDVSASDMVRAAMALANALPVQQFEPRHALYLQKQIVSMETIARRLSGEQFTLEEEAERCLDIHPVWIPESEFEQAHAILEELLPGHGSLYERRLAYRHRYNVPQEKMELLPRLMDMVKAEVRARTSTFVALPEEESVEIELVKQKPFGAQCWYLGQYRSKIDVNTDLPTSVKRLPDLLCHEVYPGHHTEAVLKEKILYNERGELDQAIVLLVSPQCVISEGIATMAAEMIFAPGEIEQWLAEKIYPLLGMEPDPVDVRRLEAAYETLEGVRGNVAFMLREGCSKEEMKRYLARYALSSEANAEKMLEFLSQPYFETYIFTYYYGKRLLKPHLQGADRWEIFRRVLVEQCLPSDFID